MTSSDDVNKLFQSIMDSDPALQDMAFELSYRSAPAKFRFPEGLRWCYFGKFKMFTGVWAFCWSTTRNQNKKFVSWVYQPVVGKKQWKIAKVLEHRKMKDAKARALRMYYQHKPVQDKYLALLKKRQRKGGK